MKLASGIIITHHADEVLSKLESQRGTAFFSIIRSEDDKSKPKEFLLEDAKLAIEKAYIASDNLNYIILIAPKFSELSQSKLLKILEEPPRNKAFIIITESKSALLDTIQSRMPVLLLHDKVGTEFSLDLEGLTLSKVYVFIQEHSRISSRECKPLVEQISLAAIKSKRYNLDQETLELFSNTVKALDVGSPTTFVLTTLLLKLLAKKSDKKS